VSEKLENALAAARVWLKADPDPETQDELEESLAAVDAGEAAAVDFLIQRFGGRLAFGTAGIRGPLGFGPQAMNRVVVSHTTAGIARYLLSHSSHTDHNLRVLVGYDARKNSAVFAQDTAEVLSGHGIDVRLTPHHVPTPIVAFGVRHLACDAAIMITASHNTAHDNGYKVYFGGVDQGSQIVSPVDQDIEHEIGLAADSLRFHEIPRSKDLVSSTPSSLATDYLHATIESLASASSPKSTITVVYTPMHGVGGETFLQVLETAGFQAPIVVEEQFTPDPTFPTVAFPNPEEKGALDLASAKASEVSADIIIAHDPDADRLAVALPVDSEARYKALTGNEVGAILGWWAAERATRANRHGALANSIASSPVLGKIANHFGLDHVETLTGFKYVSRVPGLIFGFEEALGYLVNPDVVRDKDGISAALAILDLAQALASEGLTLWDYLAKIEQKVGGFASSQITTKTEPSAGALPMTNRVRSASPQRIGTRDVISTDDFLIGVADFPKDNILRYYLSDDSRVIVRPSGTEPKVKVYLDTAGATRAAAEAALESLETDVRELLTVLTQSA